MNATTAHTSLIRRVVAATALLGALAVPAAAFAAAPAATAPATKACKSVTPNISYLNITKVGAKQPKAALGCQEANAVGNLWMLRFKHHMQVQKFSLNFINYRCKLVPSLPRNTQCTGANTIVRFSAPTGG